MREVLTAITIYFVVLATHSISHHWRHRKLLREQRAADAESLNPLSPLYQVAVRPLTLWGRCRRHAIAAVMTVSMHPATVETAKGYTLHFFVYSGIILPTH